MKTKVLVVDDSPSVLTFTAEVLTSAGYEVQTSESAWIANQVGEFRPRLILIDVNLSGYCDGDIVLDVLRDKEFAEGCLMVLYSSMTERELRGLALRIGADGYIVKTQDPSELLEKIEQVLKDHPLPTSFKAFS